MCLFSSDCVMESAARETASDDESTLDDGASVVWAATVCDGCSFVWLSATRVGSTAARQRIVARPVRQKFFREIRFT